MIEGVINCYSFNNSCIHQYVFDVIVGEELILLVSFDTQDLRNVVYHCESKQPLSVERIKIP